jgi:hypothetical protein
MKGGLKFTGDLPVNFEGGLKFTGDSPVNFEGGLEFTDFSGRISTLAIAP